MASDARPAAAEGSLHRFELYGLRVASEVPFPGAVRGDGEPADVTIRRGVVPASLTDVIGGGLLFEASEHEFLLAVDGTGRFLVSEGKRVVVETAPGVPDDQVRLFLLGSVFGALLHQRGLLPPHGSAVELGEECVVFAGLAGSGKSTLAAALARRGHRVLADDLTALTVDGEERTVALAGYPRLKLWKDALERIDGDPTRYEPVRGELPKYSVPLSEAFCAGSRPVGRLYVLTPRNRPGIKIVPVKGVGKARLLLRNTFRPRYVDALRIRDEHFRRCTAAARHLSAAVVSRPRQGFELDGLIEALEPGRRRQRSTGSIPTGSPARAPCSTTSRESDRRISRPTRSPACVRESSLSWRSTRRRRRSSSRSTTPTGRHPPASLWFPSARPGRLCTWCAIRSTWRCPTPTTPTAPSTASSRSWATKARGSRATATV